MTRLLSLFGLMRVSEPTEQKPAPTDQALRAMTASRDDWKELAGGLQIKLDDWKGKHSVLLEEFNKAVADLEKQAGEIAGLKADINDWQAAKIYWENEAKIARATAEALRPDALAMRRKRQRDRELKAAKAAKKVQP